MNYWYLHRFGNSNVIKDTFLLISAVSHWLIICWKDYWDNWKEFILILMFFSSFKPKQFEIISSASHNGHLNADTRAWQALWRIKRNVFDKYYIIINSEKYFIGYNPWIGYKWYIHIVRLKDSTVIYYQKYICSPYHYICNEFH